MLALAAVHAGLAVVWPVLTGGQLGFTLNLGWLVANLFLAGVLVLRRPVPTARTWAAAGLGYAAMLWLLWPLMRVLDENLLLLVLGVMVYGGLLRDPFLLGYLFLFLIAQRFLPAYLYPRSSWERRCTRRCRRSCAPGANNGSGSCPYATWPG